MNRQKANHTYIVKRLLQLQHISYLTSNFFFSNFLDKSDRKYLSWLMYTCQGNCLHSVAMASMALSCRPWALVYVSSSRKEVVSGRKYETRISLRICRDCNVLFIFFRALDRLCVCKKKNKSKTSATV